MLCRVAALKRLPVHHRSDFWSFVITELALCFFENRVLLKMVLEVRGSVFHTSLLVGHEQAHLNRNCYNFISLVYSLLSKDLTTELIYSAVNISRHHIRRVVF